MKELNIGLIKGRHELPVDDYIIEKVPVQRAIHADSSRRGIVNEVLIRNYEV